MNKDVANIIGRYSLPTVYRVTVSTASPEHDKTFYFFGDDTDKICQWLADNQKTLIYNVVYVLYRYKRCWSKQDQKIVVSKTDLRSILKEYNENTFDFIKGVSNRNLSDFGTGIEIEKIDPINTY